MEMPAAAFCCQEFNFEFFCGVPLNPATVGDSVSPDYSYFMQLYVTDRLEAFHLDVGLPLLAISSLGGWQLPVQRCSCRVCINQATSGLLTNFGYALLIFSETQDLKGQH